MKTKPFKRLLSATLSATLAVSGFAVTALSANALSDSYYGIFDITFKDVNKRYSDIPVILKRINELRGSELGVLELDSSLTEDSMKRAAELSINAQDVLLNSESASYEKQNTFAARHEMVIFTTSSGASGVTNALKDN